MDDDPFIRSSNSLLQDEVDHKLPDELLEEIDQALGESLGSDFSSGSLNAENSEDAEDGLSTDPAVRQMQETFLEAVKNILNPLTRYMKAIFLGDNSRELLEISELVVTPVIPQVEAVGLRAHLEDLSFFRSLLLLALGEKDQPGTRAMKEVVMEGFSHLSKRYGLKCRGYRLAVKNLVQFYRAVKSSDKISEMDIRRFFAIGVPSLTWIRRTHVSELTSLSGVSSDVMSQIRELAYEYRSTPPKRGARLAPENIRTHSTAPSTDRSVILLEEGILSNDVLDAAVDSPKEKISIIRGSA